MPTKKKAFADLIYFLKVVNPATREVTMREDSLGLKLHAYKRDAVGRGIIKTGYHDRVLTEWLLTKFKTGGNFIDVGANLGYFSCLMARIAGPDGRVLAIEPEPQNLYLLKKNLANNKLQNVLIAPVALGEKPGVARLNLYKNSNLGRHSMATPSSGRSIDVEVRTLDEVFLENFGDSERISYIKIDVEGYEPFVIKGAARTLKRTDSISIEFSPYLFNASNDLKNESFELVRTLAAQFPRVEVVSAKGLRETTVKDLLAMQEQVDVIFSRS